MIFHRCLAFLDPFRVSQQNFASVSLRHFMQLKITLVDCVASQSVRLRAPKGSFMVRTSVSQAAMSQSDKGSPLQKGFSIPQGLNVNAELTEDFD